MRIVVMGAGGVGGYVGGRLAQAGMDVTLIARGDHLAALRENGLIIETPEGVTHLPDIRACEDPADAGPADLVLFTVKLTDAEKAAAMLPPLMGEDTRILTLQNGIDSKTILERHVGAGRVAAGIIYIAAYIKAPGIIYHPGGVHRAVADSMKGDAVMAELFGLSDSLSGLDILPDDSPEQLVWGKFVNLSAFSGVTCIARSPIGRVYETPDTLNFFRALLEENVSIGRAEGLSFANDFPEQSIEFFRQQPYEQKSSMLTDLEAGKPLELPWLSGRICALGDARKIDVPANRAVVAALAPFVRGDPSRN